MRSINRLFLLCAVFFFMVLPLKAGDFAQFRPLGFSEDGSVFAFEQFGVQDGSGFPYAERYFIRTASDTFVSGTPIKIRLEDENATIAEARALADQESFPFMQEFDIGAQPANIVAFNPSTESSSAAREFHYQPYSYEPNPNPPYELALQEIELPLTPTCNNIIEKGIGIRLSLKTEPGSAAEVFYQDKSVPNSRGCPTEYRLGGVLTYENFDRPPIHVFLVLVKSFGFEGPDGRWIAIPKILN